jgi:hypothetical protein
METMYVEPWIKSDETESANGTHIGENGGVVDTGGSELGVGLSALDDPVGRAAKVRGLLRPLRLLGCGGVALHPVDARLLSQEELAIREEQRLHLNHSLALSYAPSKNKER